jgi:hypothetical protein
MSLNRRDRIRLLEAPDSISKRIKINSFSRLYIFTEQILFTVGNLHNPSKCRLSINLPHIEKKDKEASCVS